MRSPWLLPGPAAFAKAAVVQGCSRRGDRGSVASVKAGRYRKRRQRIEKAGGILNSTSDVKDQNWTLSPGDALGVVTLAGEIDFSVTPKVRERLLDLVGDAPAEIVLDMAGLAYVDSSGLALLIELRKTLAEAGRTVRIRTISPQVRKILNLTQLGELFGLPE